MEEKKNNKEVIKEEKEVAKVITTKNKKVNNKDTKDTKDSKDVKEVKKLSYEELENAARQIASQLDGVLKENMQLKNAVNKLQVNNLYTELNFRFKVVKYQDSFSPSFVEDCISDIENIMSTKEDNKNNYNKKDNSVDIEDEIVENLN